MERRLRNAFRAWFEALVVRRRAAAELSGEQGHAPAEPPTDRLIVLQILGVGRVRASLAIDALVLATDDEEGAGQLVQYAVEAVPGGMPDPEGALRRCATLDMPCFAMSPRQSRSATLVVPLGLGGSFSELECFRTDGRG